MTDRSTEQPSNQLTNRPTDLCLLFHQPADKRGAIRPDDAKAAVKDQEKLLETVIVCALSFVFYSANTTGFSIFPAGTVNHKTKNVVITFMRRGCGI